MCVFHWHCSACPGCSRGWTIPARVLDWGLWWKTLHDVIKYHLHRGLDEDRNRGWGMWEGSVAHSVDIWDSCKDFSMFFIRLDKGKNYILHKLIKMFTLLFSVLVVSWLLLSWRLFKWSELLNRTLVPWACLRESRGTTGPACWTHGLWQGGLQCFQSLPYWMMTCWRLLPSFFFSCLVTLHWLAHISQKSLLSRGLLPMTLLGWLPRTYLQSPSL